MRDRNIFLSFALFLTFVLTGCDSGNPDQQPLTLDGYVSWLYEGMSLPDSLQYPVSFFRENVQKTLEVRSRHSWDIPEREFRHFVLPLRVNNETLDDFRLLYADELCNRVEGMDIAQAALEINHWCHEKATYKGSDARTSSPLETIQRGLGRCGEESVLAVAALRAAGIPSRQVYTPRWAHTDDNHAWVEVYVDGKWHFMGACEPEPVLDQAWFNAPVSRAMLLHTKAYGDYKGPEDVISKNSCYTEINVIKGYVPTRRTNVTVTRDGQPVSDAHVSLRIYNYAEFYDVATYLTGEDGRAALDTGLGDMVIWAWKDGLWGVALARGEETVVSLDHRVGANVSLDLDIMPPLENPLPTVDDEALTRANQKRLAREDSIRLSSYHGSKAYEKWVAIRPDIKDLLSEKDHTDVTEEVLEDAFSDGRALSPRVAYEHLVPYMKEIAGSADVSSIKSPEDAARFTREHVRVITDRNPQALSIPPVYVWRSRMADEASRDIFYVALCRALGFDARLDGVTMRPQFLKDGKWMDADLGKTKEASLEKGTLLLSSESDLSSSPLYYKHFTLSSINSEGATRLLEFATDADETPVEAVSGSTLDKGCYLLTTGSRMADGSVLAHVEVFNITADAASSVPLVMRSSDEKVGVIGSMDAEMPFLPKGKEREQSLLSVTGRGYFMVSVLKGNDEPTQHALKELEIAAGILNEWGCCQVFLGDRMPSGLKNAVQGEDVDGKVQRNLEAGLGFDNSILPLVTICDSFGRIVYQSRGYNTSLSADLQSVISRL